MNPEIKTKWIAALRSGEYKQGCGRLCGPQGFCCLGVLCDLYIKETGDKATNLLTGAYPELEICKWAGLGHFNPPAGEMRLGNANDSGKSFPEIADLIEQYL